MIRAEPIHRASPVTADRDRRTYRASVSVAPSPDLPQRCLDAIVRCSLELRSLAIEWESNRSQRQSVSVEVVAREESAVRAWARRLGDSEPVAFRCDPLIAAAVWSGDPP